MRRFDMLTILSLLVLIILIVPGRAELQQRSLDATAYYNRGLAYHYKRQYDQAIADFTRVIKINPRVAEAYWHRGNAYYRKGQYDKVIADYSKPIEMKPKHPIGHNNLAWLLAMCPDARYRDGAKAVELAQKAVELRSKPIFLETLETLAAAFAEAGKFEDAITTQEKAIALLKKEGDPENRIDQYIERLNSYKAHKPWREK